MLQAQTPLVSVIIPAYNAERLIDRTLTSVLNQTYRHLEVWVIDDGSRDRTPDIVRQFAESDPRVHLLQQANGGVAAARNLGIQHAQGEFIAPIDADDLWYPQNIEKQVQSFLTSSPTVGLVYSWSVLIDSKNFPTGSFCAFLIEGKVLPTLMFHNFLGNASASMIRRSCLEQVGYYNTELRTRDAQGCEDWDLYLRLAGQYQFRVVPEFLIGYRKLQDSMSRNYRSMANSWCFALEAARQRHPEVPDSLCRLSVSYFLFYLARECDRVGDSENVPILLRSALQMNWMMLLIRPDLYRLAIKSWWQPGKRSQLNTLVQPGKKIASQSGSLKPTISISRQQWVKIWFMVWLFNLFYWLVPKLAMLQIQLPITHSSKRSLQPFLIDDT